MTLATHTELIAVITAVTDGEPRILTVGGTALPAGAFLSKDRSLQASLRTWVEQQTRHTLGYVEQLYTFADAGRTGEARRSISISYLGLTRESPLATQGAAWLNWYHYFPWEDRRADQPLPPQLEPALLHWANAATTWSARQSRRQRAAYNFALDGNFWNEELILQRYELLWEAGLVEEAETPGPTTIPGAPMAHDHRRILATGIARLRAKIKYRPVVFELMPEEFTLLELQKCVEALAGRTLHKPNFRRLITQQQLVEEAGGSRAETGGRPAKLFRFRRDVRLERALIGSKLPIARSQ